MLAGLGVGLTVIDFAKAPLQSLEVQRGRVARVKPGPEMRNPVTVLAVRFLNARRRFGNPFGRAHVDQGIACGSGGGGGRGSGGDAPNGFGRGRVVGSLQAIAAW